MSRIYINDYAMANALGIDKNDVWNNWQAGNSPGMTSTEKYSPGMICPVGKLTSELPELAPEYTRYNSRNNRLLHTIISQMTTTLSALKQRFGNDRIGLVIGTSTSGISVAEDGLEHAVKNDGIPASDYTFSQHGMGAGIDFLKEAFDIKGPGILISTACSSSGNAFATARRLINTGVCDAVITGGADTLCRLTIQGFSSLESVSQQVCNPLSINRNGINIGEAAACFIISGIPSKLELKGVGQSSDAHHISAPDPTGNGAFSAMQQALTQADLPAEQVDYVNLHGTATPLNDAMESKAVYRLVSDSAAISSTKSLTGHTLGAAAATELGLCALLIEKTIEHGAIKIPAQRWDQEYDPDIAPLNIVKDNTPAAEIKNCLSNSFAFGGNNTSLLIGLNND
ncbi:3-oxoacyl-[acyl-carrier-protein] synthase 2 [BD1-7 clade bacterium]|uniref:3-oxoacyl-[acyl-carrier-protein] synthase 2 n=1 Tax=BD1-7 clade bacterium TaxID=2029982 RepID=A0A5S9PUW5_9GAMM|nr:3-oxoacyl-[acyl-carrier-protein] synthase 2 [BD1-7 clade bacterium]